MLNLKTSGKHDYQWISIFKSRFKSFDSDMMKWITLTKMFYNEK